MNKTKSVRVSDHEILFFKKHAPTGFPRLIMEALEARGRKYDRSFIHREISTIKASYNADIINMARRLLKEVKGVEYQALV